MRVLSIVILAITLFMTSACQKASEPVPQANLMIMLTKAETGLDDASFIEVSDDENCAERVKTARAVFPAANIEYVAHYCVYSKPKFEAFAHGTAPSGPPHVLQLEFSKDKHRLISVQSFEVADACLAGNTTVCVASAQNVVE